MLTIARDSKPPHSYNASSRLLFWSVSIISLAWCYLTTDMMQIRNVIWRLETLLDCVICKAGMCCCPHLNTTCPSAPHLRRMDILPIILPSLYPDNLQPATTRWPLQTLLVIDYLIVNCPVKRSIQKLTATEKKVSSEMTI